MMRTLLGIVVLTGLAYGEDQPKQKADDGDQKKLQGEWVLTSGIVDGKDKSKEWVKQGFKGVITESSIGKDTFTRPRVSLLP